MNFKHVIHICVILVSMFYCIDVSAQHVSVGYTLRGETFAMDDLKYLHGFSTETWPVNGNLLVDMPANISHAGFIYLPVAPDVTVGISAGYSSTGSRYYYEDYSGHLSSDFVVSRYDISVPVTYYEDLDRIQVLFRLEPVLNLSRLKIKSSLSVNDIVQQGQSDFKSQSYSLRPGVGLLKSYKRLELQLVVLYEVYFESELLLEEDDNYRLQDQYGDSYDVDWSGVKLNVSLGFLMGKL